MEKNETSEKRPDVLDQEVTRSMKHLLIRDLLRYRLRVTSPYGLRYGADIDVGDWVNGQLISIPVAVRTASLTKQGKRWRYSLTVPSRNEFPDAHNFIWALVFEEYDECRPSYYLLISEELKRYIESTLDKAESWRDDEPYTFHPTRETLKNELCPYKGFKLIDRLLGRQTPEPYRRPSQEYWDSKNWLDEDKRIYVQ